MKKILTGILLFINIVCFSQLPDTVLIGTPGAGQGDTLHNAFTKLNSNDQYLDSLINTISFGSEFDTIVFSGEVPAVYAAYTLYADTVENTLSLMTPFSDVTMQIGLEVYRYVRNMTGVSTTNGRTARNVGSTGTVMQVGFGGIGSRDSSEIIGIFTHDIAINGFGFVTVIGRARDFNTSDCTEGSDGIFASHNGYFSDNPGRYPNKSVRIGYCVRSHINQGIIEIAIERTTDAFSQTICPFQDGDGQFDQDSGYYNYIKSNHTLYLGGDLEIRDTNIIDLITEHGGGDLYQQNQTYNDAFNLGSFKETEYNEYIQSSAMSLPFPVATYGQGQKFTLPIYSDGNTIAINTGYNLISSDFSTSVEGMYLFYAQNIGSQWYYNFILSGADTIPTPTIIGGTLAGDNSYIDVVMSTDIYGINNGTLPVLLSDFTVIFAQNGGTATAWTADSIRDNNNVVLVTGEDTIRVYGTITGTSDGNETVTITPVDGSSIFNITGIAMSAAQTTGAISFGFEVDIVWTNIVGGTAVGNTFTKTNATNGATDARYIPAGSEGYVVHTIADLDADELGIYGLSAGAAKEAWDEINYSTYNGSTNSPSIIETGVTGTVCGCTISAGGLLKTAKELQGDMTYDIVYYYDLNGVSGFTELDRTEDISDVDLYPKGSIYDVTGGSRISNAVAQGIQ